MLDIHSKTQLKTCTISVLGETSMFMSYKHEMHKSNMYVHVYHPKVFENNKRGELCTHLGLLISLENKTNLTSKYHGINRHLV
ncbi:hypothetical protein HanRHA438_Chr14g0633111 [Helianthus annuus]|nr:hypothetical protein HanRHA438_Chr14g0633111 [Helianthus annuus]